MCTVTIIRDPAGVTITMNRDEARERPESGPTFWAREERAYLAPVDIRAGGSWIAVNDRGVCACLLNRHDRTVAGARSRGGILLHVMAADGLDEAAARIHRLSAKDYAPFTVLAVTRTAGIRFDWTGSTAALEPLGPENPGMVTSSSWNTAAVSEYRQRYFLECLASGGNLEQFHTIAPLGKARWAPMVERGAAFTKSIVQVELGQHDSTMRYWRRASILSDGLRRPDNVETLGVVGVPWHKG